MGYLIDVPAITSTSTSSTQPQSLNIVLVIAVGLSLAIVVIATMVYYSLRYRSSRCKVRELSLR